MESESVSFPSNNWAKCCSCSCSCTLINSKSLIWNRSVKRKFDQVDGFSINFPSDTFDYFSTARVEAENECEALREALSSQQQTIQDLYTELDEERNASSSAANETMSMILRLQREKAEIQMEARQFKRFAEEKMAHDQQELVELDDLLYKHEETIKALSYEIQVYKHRMLSYGLTEDEVEGDKFDPNKEQDLNLDQDRGQNEVEKCDYSQSHDQNQNPNVADDYETEYKFPPTFNYPPLKCNLNETQSPRSDVTDFEKYPFGETPQSGFSDSLNDLEHKNPFGRTQSSNQLDGEYLGKKNVFEKSVLGQSPRQSRHTRRYSVDSCGSFFGPIKKNWQDCEGDTPRPRFKKMDYLSHPLEYSNLRKVENASEFGDDMSDRVYTIDSIHNGAPHSYPEPKAPIGIRDDYISSPRESLYRGDRDPEIKTLYKRLQELEADRESMKQAIISMRTDRAQLILLREIAQNLCKEMSPERRMSLKKSSLVGKLSLKSALKCAVSLVSWKKKARRSNFIRNSTSFCISHSGSYAQVLITSTIKDYKFCVPKSFALVFPQF